MNREQIVLGGFGGQGIILAGFILGQAAAIFDKRNATFTQDYGPEARGGACRAQVVISNDEISYPYVEKPSVLVVMSQEAYTRYSPELPEGAPLLIDSELVKTRRGDRHKVLSITATRFAAELGRSGAANVVMLGFLTAVSRVTSLEAMKKSIAEAVPVNTRELNLKAFERGYSYGLKQVKAA